MNAFNVERIVALSDAELANVRGVWCKDCKSRDCDVPGCERCDVRHAHNLVDLGDDKSAALCLHCQEIVECASCGEKYPRYETGSAEGEPFGPSCYGQDPKGAWT